MKKNKIAFIFTFVLLLPSSLVYATADETSLISPGMQCRSRYDSEDALRIQGWWNGMENISASTINVTCPITKPACAYTDDATINLSVDDALVYLMRLREGGTAGSYRTDNTGTETTIGAYAYNFGTWSDTAGYSLVLIVALPEDAIVYNYKHNYNLEGSCPIIP